MRTLTACLALIVMAAGPALAQPPIATSPAPPPPAPALPPSDKIAPPAPVGATALAAPDAFSTPGRDTGLPPTLWRGASLATAKSVLPLLGEKPLSPAGAALARRVLATGAPGPEGALDDPDLAAQRAQALIFQGDPQSAAAILAKAPGLDRTPALARAAAESALLAGQDTRACALEQALTAGRDDIYWVRLRAYCQAIGGKTSQAQLTFDLAQSQDRDAVYGRLMGAKLAGAGDPGPPVLRGGLDYALSRSLGLDLAQAKPAPAVAAAMAQAAADPNWDLSAFAPDVAPAAQAVATGRVAAPDLRRLLDAAHAADPKGRTRLAASALIAAAFATEIDPTEAADLASLGVAGGRAPAGRAWALELAAQRRLPGQTALVALWTCAEAGAAGPTLGDRVMMIRALRAAGLTLDARNLALEGLAGLK
jgi:hypothetical protein